MANELRITRRHLPHWTLEGSTYFVTFCTHRVTLDDEEERVVVEQTKEGDGKYYDCFAAVVMPDHAHLLIRPCEGYGLSRVMHGIKGVSARKINLSRGTRGKIWQDESYDRIVRDEVEFYEKMNYMFNNPLEKGLTDDPEHYPGWYGKLDTLQ